MRLIDADNFIERLSHIPMVQEAIRKAMDKMPTIEPERKKGKWIHKGCGCFECDQCGERVSLNVYIAEKASDRFKFCPNCGADMRGEQND